MSLRYQLERLAQKLADFYFALLPRPRPSAAALEACRLVSHRGEHDNRGLRENTLAAFARAADAGVWGVEFDLRWTRDLEPVVIHDPDTRRVFGVDCDVAALELAELQRRAPEIPSLAQVVARFGGSLHLMIELKQDPVDDDGGKAARLAEVLAPLAPGRDYHILALDPQLFAPAAFAGQAACLLVAELNVAACSRTVAEHGLGGLCGHYLLLKPGLLRRHRALGQRIGTGFPTSRFAFYRELNRGVDWIFTNHAVKLAALRQHLLRRE